jgi:hypothetical protein
MELNEESYDFSLYKLRITNFANGRLCMGTDKRPRSVVAVTYVFLKPKREPKKKSAILSTFRIDFDEWKNYTFYIRRLLSYISGT